ncbi:helix-turn-helix transcriptional regulator [Paludibacterium yongneupense]|uniref:helix-turn-helix transcriptional regulator n=1 Tax=Paludibacterium yongneupense TaxID=400061 RepID=UPI0004151080|nr:YafY family protein [Paludibacterium yongneupense]
MSRAERLLELMQCLYRHRYPVSGADLAVELGVSLRTLYRDIASLRVQGAHIEGEAGVGYVLRPGFMLPPLMFSPDEIEALVLGSRWVGKRADSRLATAARDALAKIAAVLPPALRHELESTPLLVGPGAPLAVGIGCDGDDLSRLRASIRGQRKLRIHYLDLKGESSERTLWPFALGFFDQVRILVAWCEQRQAFRHFRVDRIQALEVLEQTYPRRRQALLKEWKQQEGMVER